MTTDALCLTSEAVLYAWRQLTRRAGLGNEADCAIVGSQSITMFYGQPEQAQALQEKIIHARKMPVITRWP
jgi:hypothetical protein